uniref:RNase H type-1 domain-containing protein n=1 Tax=Fagus sylvatica TaxID=28930 RepID=A0A2N9F4S3_FAGSY
MKPKHEGGLGFRDLQLFNKALLARQGWRLIHQPSSLLCRVLKAKYFPHTSFLEAGVPGNASYIWRSICDSKEVLQRGLRWRVGSGERIRIWKDRWLPSSSTYKVISPISGGDAEATVDKLICAESMSWNIPLLHSNTAAEASSSSHGNTVHTFWSSIWAASVPPKCEFAQRVWKECPVTFSCHVHVQMSFSDFMASCISDLSSPGLEIIFNTAWAIWKARNELVWNAKVTPVSELCQQAAGVALDYLELGSLLQESFSPARDLPDQKWKCPEVRNYKLNFCCKFGTGNHQVGLGVLLRDSAGLVAAALCTQIGGEGGGLQVHAHALMLALDFAFNIGLRRLEVDVGNQELLGLVNKSGPCLASVGVVIDDIQRWNQVFPFLSYSFIKNNSNKAAQALSTEALSSVYQQVWLEDQPDCITSFVQSDIMQ